MPRPAPLEPIEYEITDFATARAAHDVLPNGVERLPDLTPGYWQARRRRPVATDRALAGATIDWLLSLPPSRRPRALCDRFPRVANQIAGAWPNPRACKALLEGLLTDRRSVRRAGFPPEVREEIEALLKR